MNIEVIKSKAMRLGSILNSQSRGLISELKQEEEFLSFMKSTLNKILSAKNLVKEYQLQTLNSSIHQKLESYRPNVPTVSRNSRPSVIHDQYQISSRNSKIYSKIKENSKRSLSPNKSEESDDKEYPIKILVSEKCRRDINSKQNSSSNLGISSFLNRSNLHDTSTRSKQRSKNPSFDHSALLSITNTINQSLTNKMGVNPREKPEDSRQGTNWLGTQEVGGRSANHSILQDRLSRIINLGRKKERELSPKVTIYDDPRGIKEERRGSITISQFEADNKPARRPFDKHGSISHSKQSSIRMVGKGRGSNLNKSSLGSHRPTASLTGALGGTMPISGFSERNKKPSYDFGKVKNIIQNQIKISFNNTDKSCQSQRDDIKNRNRTGYEQKSFRDY